MTVAVIPAKAGIQEVFIFTLLFFVIPALDAESILSFSFRMLLYLSFPRFFLSFRAIAGIQDAFLSFNIREKNNIDSCLLISRITENENNKEKERKHWIPNQVGDDKK
ncbi:MAG TPA: hypothetical protein PK455_06575 [Caldisericia bacterium]|nr:hypothetical protein [Caldisericia bacterium]